MVRSFIGIHLSLSREMMCIVLFFIGTMFPVAGHSQNMIVQRLVIEPASSVVINGKTNVNKYDCAIKRYSGSDTLLFTSEPGKVVNFSKGLARLDASAFECNMDVITKDFSETIQADKYPYIDLNFISFERAPKYATAGEEFKGHLTVKLGNVAVPCEVKCSIVRDEKGLIHLRGKHKFHFSDFKLTPPTKMMGMIKVKEDIVVHFHLVLRRL